MLQIKNQISVIILCFLLNGCIESYYPKEISDAGETYVISGSVTTVPGFQTIRISKTSSITNPNYAPASNCSVIIIDTDNNVFPCTSNGEDGEYPVWIDEEHLVPGKGFKTNILTPEGIEIESEFSYLNPCPPMGNIYYTRVDKPTSDPMVFEKGVQFKVDLEADESYDRFFRWEIEETYEYRSSYPIQYYFADSVVVLPEPDFSRFYCWATKYVSNIYTLTTKGLAENKYNGYDLHFVNNHSQRLMHLYSIQVTQHALNETHYNYLEQLRKNASEHGGLFDSQPVSITGNLHSINFPEVKVLGYFGASSVTTTRLFFSNIENLDFELADMCTPSKLDMGFAPFSPDEYPVYLVLVNGQLQWANAVCFDCTLAGGTPDKPPFWP